jgi:hypothetical protein
MARLRQRAQCSMPKLVAGTGYANDASRFQTDGRVFDLHLTKPLWLDDIGDVLLCSENMRPGVCSRMSVQISLLQHQRCA